MCHHVCRLSFGMPRRFAAWKVCVAFIHPFITHSRNEQCVPRTALLAGNQRGGDLAPLLGSIIGETDINTII